MYISILLEMEANLTTSRARDRGDATRLALLIAGCELFGEIGYAATSIEGIAARAGVTKGAVYHHFSDKAQLFRKVFERVMDEMSNKVASGFLEPDHWTALVGGCQAMIDAQLDPAFRRIVLSDARSVIAHDVTRTIESRYGEAGLRAALRNAMRAGVIEPQPLWPLAVMLAGALREVSCHVAQANDSAQARQEVRGVVLRILEGLKAARKRGVDRSSDS